MERIRFEANRIISDTREFEIENVVGLTFSLSFENPSKVCLAVKKPNSGHKISAEFGYFALKIAGISLGVVLLAWYSVLIAIIAGLVLLRLTIPRYWRIYKECHANGILTYEMEDVVEFVRFQKLVWENERGKKLIRHGFVMGKSAEELFYVFLPTGLYNSDKFRYYLRIFTQVIYPIFIIVIPLVLGFCVMFAKNTKKIYKLLKKDKFVKLILFIADEGAEFIEDQLDDYTVTRAMLIFIEKAFDKLGDCIEIASDWLKMEVVLIFMKIEYFNHCYVSVWKSTLAMLKFWGGFLKRHGFGFFVSPIEIGVKRINNAIHTGKDLQKNIEEYEKIQEEVSKVSKNIDKKTN
jgi:hypothetical protein